MFKDRMTVTMLLLLVLIAVHQLVLNNLWSALLVVVGSVLFLLYEVRQRRKQR